MKPTNRMIHFSQGGNSVLGLQIMQDANGEEFVHYQGAWTHISEVPLPRLHTEEIASPSLKTKRVPVFHNTPVAPSNVAAFQEPLKHTICDR